MPMPIKPIETTIHGDQYHPLLPALLFLYCLLPFQSVLMGWASILLNYLPFEISAHSILALGLLLCDADTNDKS